MGDLQLSGKHPFKNASTSKGNVSSMRALKYLSRSQGLTENDIMRVISTIESKDTFTGTKNKLKLISCLIPMKSISKEAFVRMSCLLSNSKVCIELKVEILKWMIAVYSVLEISALETFHSLYEMFLQFLGAEILQPYVCHLLYLITEKRDVSPRRVNCLKRLIKRKGRQLPLVFLLIAYFKLNPGSFDEEIKESIEYDFPSLGAYPDLMKRVHPSFKPIVSKVSISTHEANFSKTETWTGSSIITSEKEKSHDDELAHLSFHEIFQEFQTLKKSTNISKILKSKYRRLFLTSYIPVPNKIKIYDFIMTSLYDYENFSSCDFLYNILEIFHEMQESYLSVSDFTEILISSWDGTSNLDIITSLLQYQPICCFQKIAYKLDLIREQLLKASVPIKCELFYCLSKIYENWILMQYNRFPYVPCDGNCSILEDNSTYTSHKPKDEIYKLGTVIDFICNNLVGDTNFNPCLLNEVLLHYERISIIHTKRDELVLRLPTYAVFNAALFSFSSFTLDNLSRLMLRCNTEICHMQEKKNDEAEIARQYFRLCSHDIHNLSLHGRERNENTYLSKTKVFLKLKELFPSVKKVLCLYRHPALLMKTASFLKKNPNYMFENNSAVRRAFLQYLAEDGVQNLIKFVTLA